jgi:hypothetical protein
MAEGQSPVLIFEKVPTKGFKLEVIDDRIRRARIPGGWLVAIRDEGADEKTGACHGRVQRQEGEFPIGCGSVRETFQGRLPGKAAEVAPS